MSSSSSSSSSPPSSPSSPRPPLFHSDTYVDPNERSDRLLAEELHKQLNGSEPPTEVYNNLRGYIDNLQHRSDNAVRRIENEIKESFSDERRERGREELANVIRSSSNLDQNEHEIGDIDSEMDHYFIDQTRETLPTQTADDLHAVFLLTRSTRTPFNVHYVDDLFRDSLSRGNRFLWQTYVEAIKSIFDTARDGNDAMRQMRQVQPLKNIQSCINRVFYHVVFNLGYAHINYVSKFLALLCVISPASPSILPILSVAVHLFGTFTFCEGEAITDFIDSLIIVAYTRNDISNIYSTLTRLNHHYRQRYSISNRPLRPSTISAPPPSSNYSVSSAPPPSSNPDLVRRHAPVLHPPHPLTPPIRIGQHTIFPPPGVPFSVSDRTVTRVVNMPFSVVRDNLNGREVARVVNTNTHTTFIHNGRVTSSNDRNNNDHRKRKWDEFKSVEIDEEIKKKSTEIITCSICFTNVRNVVLTGCNHLSMCSDCVGSVYEQDPRCPICRTPFGEDDVARVIIS